MNKLIRITCALAIVATLYVAYEWITVGGQGFKEDSPATTAADLSKITAYLSTHYPTFEVTPAQCKGDGIQTAYPGLRFYFVDTTYRGGAAPSERIVRNQLNLLMSIGAQGSIREWKLPGDYNFGLMKIGSRSEARIAAAAILNLVAKYSDPKFSIKPSEISASQEGGGWLCTATKGYIKPGVPGVEYSVTFDAGKCQSYSIKSNYPPPM